MARYLPGFLDNRLSRNGLRPHRHQEYFDGEFIYFVVRLVPGEFRVQTCNCRIYEDLFLRTHVAEQHIVGETFDFIGTAHQAPARALPEV